MSQNKTVIPESEYDIHKPNYSDMSSVSEFYRPTGSTVKSTVISGMDSGAVPPPVPSSGKQNSDHIPNDSHARRIPLQERVIIGVLFSISKGLLGEIFPIYLGRNMIGSSPDCDVCLKEQTVSGEHAILFARSDGYPGECILSLTDYGSTHGTMVNQSDGRYDTLTVNDGDVLTIGKHYRLSIKLFDVAASGLFEDEEFESMDSSQASASTYNQSISDFYSPSQNRADDDNRTVIV